MSANSINLGMQTEIRMGLYRSDIIALTESVFLSMLGMEIRPTDTEPLPEAELVAGTISFSGVWKGVVILQCTSGQACAFAARLMGIPEPDQFGDDARSAMEELTNILGGNLKPLLPRGAVLSMPQVVEGPYRGSREFGKNPLIELAFSSELGVLGLRVVSQIE